MINISTKEKSHNYSKYVFLQGWGAIWVSLKIQMGWGIKMLVKGYKFTGRIWVSFGYIMHSIVIIANTTVLYTSNLLRY